MDRLAQQQKRLAAEIDGIIVNYKKDPVSRKKKAEYFEERLRRIEAAWDVFEETDTKIRELEDMSETHDYFTSSLYETTQANFQQFQAHFKEKLLELRHLEQGGEEQSIDMAPAKQSSKSRADDSVRPIDANAIKLLRRYDALANSLRRLFSRLEQTEEHSRQFCKVKIASINQYWSQLEEYQQQIWEFATDPDLNGFDLKEHINLEEIVQEWLIKLETMLDELNTTPAPLASTTTNPRLNLPKITLPKFEGDYLQWRQFRDLFTQMVHNQPMSNCQKMWYLKANLTGEADKLVRNFAIADDNYESVWKTLNERYENRRLLVTALLHKLMAQPSIPSERPSAAAVKSLHDTTAECLRGLQNIDVVTLDWDPLLLHILMKKLDTATHTLYEQSLANPRDLQSLKDFLSFLEMRFQALEALGNQTKRLDEPRKKNIKSTSAAVTTSSCLVCNQAHPVYYCPDFLQLTPSKRLKLVQAKKLCVNCFRDGHKAVNCTSRGCKECAQKHNSLLHLGTVSKARQTKPQTEGSTASAEGHKASQDGAALSLTTLSSHEMTKYVLLSTAIVKLISNNGKTVECRAVLDPGSQINLITERIVKKLNLASTYHSTFIEKVGGSTERAQKRVNVTLQSKLNGYTTRLEAHVRDKIISPQPSMELKISQWSIPKNLKLADPNFHLTERIDLLLSAEHFYDILAIGQIKLGRELPVLQNTLLGWIVAGKVGGNGSLSVTCGVLAEDQQLNSTIERFWKLEEVVDAKSQYTAAERSCETHFCQSTQRQPDGRFLVRLPFSNNPDKLGESKDIAIRRFYGIERRLAKNPELKRCYQEFMDDYIRLGHMQEVTAQVCEESHYFLPHHCVLKPDSSTTKIRVVFDASCKTTSNVSLNDILYTGPTIQDDLFAILLRFRLPRYVFTADIQKMYRQIVLHPDDRNYQLLVWRNNSNQALRIYQLNTVTYGTRCAPYLATKCLQRLARDANHTNPLGANILQRDFYVDDVMTGSNSLIETVQTQEELIRILAGAGMKLRKWCANHPRLLQSISPDDQEVQLDFKSHSEDFIKTLGLTWLPKEDEFEIRITLNPEHTKFTKRTISSDIAKMFDPLGIMGPVIVTAKLFLQDIWRLKLDWDAALPEVIHTRWSQFRRGLSTLEKQKFPRHMFSKEVPKEVQLHIFCDASEKAYGAAVYVRSTLKDGRIVVRLLCAKSRVAPIHVITVPRLELCAAKLGAELAERVKTALHLEEVLHIFWTDSQIVLAWINSTASSYNTFVANRVSTIQSLSIPEQWRHVDSKRNPADILSRGIAPGELAGSSMWFYGPRFLHGTESLWPPEYIKGPSCDLEKKRERVTVAATVVASTDFIDDIQHGNSFKKLQRIIAYVLRFVDRISQRQRATTLLLKSFSSQELARAIEVIVKHVQKDEFRDVIKDLKDGKELNKTSQLVSLAPFIDEQGILRVGGRLEASTLSYDAKHPILLPYKNPLTKLLMTDIHQDKCHLGPQALLATTRQRFWPIKGKTLARSIVQRCIRCARANPQLLSQVMGNLPSTRVQPARPFINSGVDFAGPMMIHYRGRGTRPQKGYLAIFCCFATKAVHLELVSDLSTEAFIGSLKRFIGRRGHCRNLYCDNATNFVGAHNQLKELATSIHSAKSQERIAAVCNTRNIDFHFIPPRAPHFGGLWEAAVKSAKYLLHRGASSATLTYEELQTLMVEVEAILNSRPLTPLSEDPNDLAALTPGHFLIGEPPTAIVDATAEPVKGGLLTRWKLVSHIKHEFWRRWSEEYLNQLQHRSKWKQSCQNVQPGMFVIIKEDNMPVMKWPLGRITKIYKGNDDFVRVADVKTSSGVIKRAIHRLAPLPLNQDTHCEKGASKEDIPESKRRPSIEDDQEPCGSKDPPKKRKRGTSIVSLLLACLIVPLVHAEPVKVSTFGTHPGLHFQSLGNAYLSTSEWKLVIYYDLGPYWTELTTLENGTKMLQQLCEQGTFKTSCLMLRDHFIHLQNDLTNINRLLKVRTKRGAFNIVGSVAKSLFGVLDEEYANQMTQTIKGVKGNQVKLYSLLKNQTSIIDSTLNIIKRSEETVQQRFKVIEEELDQLTNIVRGPNQEGNQSKVTNLITMLSFQMTLITINLQRIQASIVSIITDTQHGNFNPLLLSQKQLSEAISNIKEHLPDTLRFPAANDNFLRLFRVASISARLIEDFVIFEFKIPLVNTITFDLYRLYPIPTARHNRLIAIIPGARYLIISQHRDLYYPLREEEYITCIQMEPAIRMCQQSHPLYHKEANISTCEVMLLKDIPSPVECSITELENSALWSQILFSNEWIYALTNRTVVHVVCGGKPSTLTLKGSGIIKMDSDCTLKSDTVTIQGHQRYANELSTSYTRVHSPTTNIKTSNNSHNESSQDYQAYISQLDELKQQLNAQESIDFDDLDNHDIHQYTIGYLSLALIISLATYLIFKCRSRQRITREQRPIPRPRRHSLPVIQA